MIEKVTDRVFHPVANLFPLMSGAAFEDLVADIKKNGLREPILCDAGGRILDGRNRYRACLKAGVEPRFETWRGEGSQAELALSLNLHRRHLDESQRAMVAARLARLLEKDAARRSGTRTDLVANLRRGQFGRTCEQAGGMVNVSPRLITHAAKVLRDGCDDLIQAVESGGLAVSTASVLAAMPKAEQAAVIAEGPRAAAAKARQLRGSMKNAQPSPGGFGVLEANLPMKLATEAVLLWVDASGLREAIDALKARGFHYNANGSIDKH